jgi:indole-3-glycerol phosphate synthase
MTTSVDTRAEMSNLQEMVAAAERDFERRQATISIEQLEEKLRSRDDPRPFGEALTRSGMSVIAEYKRCSPSEGQISDVPVADQVLAYERGGAAALSVLTHEPDFGGSLEDLRSAREACGLPILRKDFIVDVYQLYEAAAYGADAVLLIAAVLDLDELGHLYREARRLDLDCIVEVRKEEEFDAALEIDADIIGINNRDLVTLETDVNTTFALLKRLPTGKTVVSESGIEGRDQLIRLQEAGVDAALIGHTLMRAPDPEAQMRELLQEDEATREYQLP